MDRLGYGRWGARGGDWGAMVAFTLGHIAPDGLAGLHLNFMPFQPTQEEIAETTPDERRMLDDAAQ